VVRETGDNRYFTGRHVGNTLFLIVQLVFLQYRVGKIISERTLNCRYAEQERQIKAIGTNREG
jgi:hypothetical protein